MRVLTRFLGFLVVLAAAPLAASEFWIHLDVVDPSGGSRVRINLPFDRLSEKLPAVDGDHCSISAGSTRVSADDLREVLDTAVRTGAYESDDLAVRLEGGDLLFRSKDDEVTLRMPVWLAQALVSGSEYELDVPAAVRAIREHGGGALDIVADDGVRIRLWVDRKVEY